MKRLSIVAAALALAGCQSITPQEATTGNAVLTAGNTAGAIIAGVLNPALAIPAGAAAGALNASNCAATKSLGGTC